MMDTEGNQVQTVRGDGIEGTSLSIKDLGALNALVGKLAGSLLNIDADYLHKVIHEESN